MTTLWPSPSSGSIRPSSSNPDGPGRASRTSRSPPPNGSIGSTTAARSSTATTSHPLKQKTLTTLTTRPQRPPESQTRKSPDTPGRFNDASGNTLCGLVQQAVGGHVHIDGWPSCRRLAKLGYTHLPRTQHPGRIAADDLDDILPRVHRAISNLKSSLQGTHRGVSSEHLQVYSTSSAPLQPPAHAIGRVPNTPRSRQPATSRDLPRHLCGQSTSAPRDRPLNAVGPDTAERSG